MQHNAMGWCNSLTVRWWEIGMVGDWDGGRLGWWEIGMVGDWEGGRLGWWEIGTVGDWDGADGGTF
jgi:hypothetical protein